MFKGLPKVFWAGMGLLYGWFFLLLLPGNFHSRLPAQEVPRHTRMLHLQLDSRRVGFEHDRGRDFLPLGRGSRRAKSQEMRRGTWERIRLLS